jgi:cytolysin (calcineurin-like family phosphatase)
LSNSAAMFALLAPAGFAVVVGLKAKLDAHAQWKAAQQRQKTAAGLRGAAAGILPDEELEAWRAKAELATERLKGLETLVQVRVSVLENEACAA